MSGVFTPGQALAQPEYWNTRTDIPQLDDYDTIEDWQADLDAFLATQNATPAYPGLSPNSPNYGKSQAQIDAETLNRRVQWHDNGPGLGVALQNQINQGMPIIQSAYGAVDSDGTALLADPLVAMLESMGTRPTAEQTAPRQTPGVVPPVSNPPAVPDTVDPQGSWHWDGKRWIWAGPIGSPPADWSTMPTEPPAEEPPAAPAEEPPAAPPEEPPYYNTRDIRDDPSQMTMAAAAPEAATPQQLIQQYGTQSTIDPRYPDWLVLANRRRKAKLTGQRPNDLMNY